VDAASVMHFRRDHPAAVSRDDLAQVGHRQIGAMVRDQPFEPQLAVPVAVAACHLEQAGAAQPRGDVAERSCRMGGLQAAAQQPCHATRDHTSRRHRPCHQQHQDDVLRRWWSHPARLPGARFEVPKRGIPLLRVSFVGDTHRGVIAR
jgi:hypothetical protein